jgi:hypothetical protein
MMNAGAKCSDCFGCTLGGIDHDGYVPDDIGIGGGDYISITYCMDCGRLRGTFPIPPSQMEEDSLNEV